MGRMAAPEPDGMSAVKGSKKRVVVAAVSGGPDSVYLLRKKLAREKGTRVTVGHVNYGTRGKDSAKDRLLVDKICKSFGIEMKILNLGSEMNPREHTRNLGPFPPGFENRARVARYRFLKGLSEKIGAEKISLAHTADDQVETVLMRVFEGAGIAGLKGIPREIRGEIERPILDVWKEDILKYLKKHKIRYRIDRSNFDTRFERNWVRHVLIPLLVKRYGKAVKKRIFILGERFRELNDYIEAEASRWEKRNLADFSFRRERFSALPTILRVKILQKICFDRLGLAPNERLLKAMDGTIRNGGPSARVKVGKGWSLVNRYEFATFHLDDSAGSRKAPNAAQKLQPELVPPGEYEIPGGPGNGPGFIWIDKGKVTPAQARRFAGKGGAEAFDAAALRLPLMARALRAGDRIRPFGLDTDKKVKEILIDRKIPRDERWGRPVLCDAEGTILWVPGVSRSAHAPVTQSTRKTVLLRFRSSK
jgi:tRNA(Ile)-lysidine synthase